MKTRWGRCSAIMLVLLGWFAFFRISVYSDLTRRMRELSEAGYPMTLTELDGVTTLRLAVGQTNTQRRHVEQAWQVLQREAAKLA